MASSIQLKMQRQLKEQKIIDRKKEQEEWAKAEAETLASKEVSDRRIARKMKIIESGGVVPNPAQKKQAPAKAEPVVEKVKVEPPKKEVAKKKVTKKKVAKKKGRPAKKK
jgi:hypothetical protein